MIRYEVVYFGCFVGVDYSTVAISLKIVVTME